MKNWKARIVLIVLLALIWFLLTYPFDPQEAWAAVGVIAIIAALPLPGVKALADFRWTPKALVYGLGYIFAFLWQLLRSNIDVAFRVLHPRLPIEPGIVRVKTTLKSAMGRTLLANSITLTPGTITVDMDGDDVYVHWIKVQGEGDQERTATLVAGFEKYLEVMCG